LQSIKNQLSLLFVGQIETLTSTQINFLNAVIDGETAFSRSLKIHLCPEREKSIA